MGRYTIISKTATLGLIAVIAAVAAVSTLTWAILERVVIPNTGSVEAVWVGVYWDSGCTNEVTSIDWGVVEVGATENVVVYIKNEGSAQMTLSLATEDWTPAIASTYINLSWDYEGAVIDVDGVIQVTLSLSVSDLIEGVTNFSFNIVITGSG